VIRLPGNCFNTACVLKYRVGDLIMLLLSILSLLSSLLALFIFSRFHPGASLCDKILDETASSQGTE